MASRKIYEAQFMLGAKVHSSLGKGFGAAQKNMKALQHQTKRNVSAFNGMSSAIKRVAGIAAGYMGFSAIMNYAKQSSELAQAQIDAETKLATVMRQRMNATDDQVESILKLTSAQQKLGVIGDEVQIAGAQQLATFLKQTDSLDALVPAMNNLLAQQKGLKGTQQDAVNIANMMGKVFIGQTGALRRVGISFSAAEERVLKYGNEQEKAAMLAQIITNNVGHMNAELAKTDQGKLQQSKNLLGDMQEEIGKKIIPLQAKWAEIQVKMIPHIMKIVPLLDKIPPVIDKIADAVDFVIANWDKIAPIIKTVTIALLANKAAMLAVVAAQKAGLIIQTLTKGWHTASAALALLREGNSLAAVAQMLLNGTMLACPVTWIVAGITAIAAGAYLLIKNWDKVKNFFAGLWAGIVSGFEKFKQFALNAPKWVIGLLSAFMPIVGIPMLIIRNWDKVKALFAGIGKIVGKVGGFFGKIFGGGGKKTVEVHQYAKGPNPQPVGSQPKPQPSPVGGLSSRPSPYMMGVPQYATGTRYHPGGPAIVGERGREMINLPRGSQVTPNNRTEQLLNGLSGGAGGGMSLRIEQNFYGPADREEVKQANRESMSEFERKFNELMGSRRRLQFA